MAIQISGSTVIHDSQDVQVSGVVTATSFHGDASQLTNLPAAGSSLEATASGTLADGSTVIVNSDGTVSVITQTTIAASAGTSVVYNSASTYDASAVYDSSNGKVVIAYRAGSSYGTAVVGTVSGTSISFGTPVVFESASTYDVSAVYDSSNGKVVIAYRDSGNSSRGTAVVGTVSGTSISFGSPQQFESGATLEISATYDSSNGKVVIAYRDQGNSNRGTAIVGTVSGTSITFGSAVLYHSNTVNHVSATYDSSNNKVVIAYQDEANSDYGTAIVGTVSGTSISFGSAVVFESSDCDSIAAIYDSTNGKVVIAYRDDGDSKKGKAVVGTVSGTSISFGTPVVFKSDYASIQGIAFDSANGKSVISYIDVNNSNYGTAIVFSATSFVTNVTAENYIGIAAESISDGQTGKVNIIGGVNSGQTGLTTARTYYVQQDGTLGLSADVPSVVAGTSISSTKIIVKG